MKIKLQSVEDQILGTVFGHAIGDALGVGAEFLSKNEVKQKYPDGLQDYAQIQMTGFSALLTPGKWSDDTAQMLCILASILHCQKIDEKDIAKRFYYWLVDDGFGVGQTVHSVVDHPEFLTDPHRIAHMTWVLGGRKSAANGGVMRTSVIGVWNYWNQREVIDHAASVCKLTHADPRCVASCVAVSLMISELLNSVAEIETATHKVISVVEKIEPEAKEYISKAINCSLSELDLDCGCSKGEENRIGYTYTTLAAAFWALAHAQTFEEGVYAIINEGGDADTNACVAGALLGARFGYSQIPKRWIDGLVKKEFLKSECRDLLRLLNDSKGNLDCID
ncbi:ADP-ribosylglycohydrolase family protein [Candidatus Sumerlaeota bacterium]|nr:ADP-ribosylglycohydrolase family protein [Candidatus Sumerlaeota bacterium]